MPVAMWLCTHIFSPRPTLNPVSSGCGLLAFGLVWPCRMLIRETPIDSRSSMPTTEAGEEFMATWLCGGDGRAVDLVFRTGALVAPNKFPSCQSRGLAKRIQIP